MSDTNKRYYWLKLKENFFEQEEIKIIESMPNGIKYTNFYLKLILKSISTEGRLLFRGIMPYTPEMLSTITNTDIDTVRVAIDLFVKLGLMEIWSDGTLFMMETQNMIGSEGASAKRMRESRQKQEILANNPSQCDNAVTISDTEKEIDREREKEKDIYTNTDIEEIWSMYTRKKNKQNAIPIIKELLKTNTKEEIIRAITLFIAEVKRDKIESKYQPYGDKFFKITIHDYLGREIKPIKVAEEEENTPAWKDWA